jgi:23S rRNA (cytosine1962-C5)-methyltransferase
MPFILSLCYDGGMKKLKLFQLKKGHDRRFRGGHPWVYSNELSHSPKGVELGEWVELQGPSGERLARGHAHPSSLISFRAIERDLEKFLDWDDTTGYVGRFQQAWSARSEGEKLTNLSFRWVFGEADGLSGCILDRYLLERAATSGTQTQLLVLQLQSAGMDRDRARILEALKKVAPAVTGFPWTQTVVLDLPSNRTRKNEGLPEREAEWLWDPVELQATPASWVRVSEFLSLHVDFSRAQKTGLFLDQREHAQSFSQRIHASKDSIRILDLCSYVGQWSSILASRALKLSPKVEVLLVDQSAEALKQATINLERLKGLGNLTLESRQMDVLHDLGALPSQSFDWVISDPPALITSRKDIPQGTRAYIKLHAEAIRLSRRWVVCSSCSGLLKPEEFRIVLARSEARAHPHVRGPVRWVEQRGPSFDHPWLAGFPEGHYLKTWLGLVTSKLES